MYGHPFGMFVDFFRQKDLTNQSVLCLPHRNDSPEARLDKIIRDLYEKTDKQVVVLVDEADGPFVEAIRDSPRIGS